MKPSNGRKEKDHEDLLLFKELQKREKDRLASLLQPVSEEFEPNSAAIGNHALYRIVSGKKGSGFELFGENDKSDYSWLKTPPATPLFPSLEMEANAPQLVLQRELPIIQPSSRLAGIAQASMKPKTVPPKSPINSKPKMIPRRSITPGSRRSTQNNNTESSNQKMNHINKPITSTSKSSKQKETHAGSRVSTAGSVSDSITNPTTNCLRSNDTPPNLKTERPASAMRGRPVASNPTVSATSRRQSCSPSVARGRKVNEEDFACQKGKIQSGNHIFGSKIVDKVMNGRKERVQKPKAQNPAATSDSSNAHFGRMVLSRSLLDMPLNQLEIKRDVSNPQHRGFVSVKNYTREYIQ